MIYSRFDTKADAEYREAYILHGHTRHFTCFSLYRTYMCVPILYTYYIFFITWPPFKRKYIVSTSARGVKVLFAFRPLLCTRNKNPNAYIYTLYYIIYLCILYNIIICPMNIVSDTDILCKYL